MRNGNRWRVYAIDPDNHRIAARRLNDGARTVFTGDYLRDHITNGYAITVHSAQGATADTTHAVLRDTTSRELFHVAMSRGRQANTAYLAPQLGRDDHGGQGLLVLDGESGRPSRHAAELARSIIANDTDRLRTAHNAGNYSVVPERVRALLSRRQQHTAERRTSYLQWQHAHLETASQGDRDVSRALHRERTHEIDL